MGYRSWRQSKCRSSSSFPSPFSILERKGHKSLCEEEQAGLAVTQDLKEGGPVTPENFLQTGFAPLPVSPFLGWAS